MANVNIRVDDSLKRDAEHIFAELGLSISAATNVFYKQVVRCGGIPFDMKLAKHEPLNFSVLSEQQFNAQIDKGLADLAAGKIVTAKDVATRMRQDYGL